MNFLSSYLHENTKIIGSGIYYKENTTSLKNMKKLHPNAHPSNLRAYFINENLRVGNYNMIEKEDVGATTNPGGYLNYHVPGEKAYFFSYLATR